MNTMLTEQDRLVFLLKQKGTGKQMSKALSVEQCREFLELCCSDQVSVTTVTTLLVAFFMLDNTDTEQRAFEQIRLEYRTLLPVGCHFLFDTQHHQGFSDFLAVIHSVLRHQDCSEQALILGIQALFDTSVPDPMKAAFLEGLRLKEESMDENRLFLRECRDRNLHRVIDCPLLIDIANPYDGFNRHHGLLLFAAPVLASLGIPVVLHGCESSSPKQGITFHKLLAAAGKNPLLTLNNVVKHISNPDLGWGYTDQADYFPALRQLTSLRTAMVKRPVLATVEKFLQPIRSSQCSAVVTGFTHPGYRDKTRALLDDLDTVHRYSFVRGVEGSAQLPLDRRAPLICSDSADDGFVSPADFGMSLTEKTEPNLQLSVTDTLDYGEALLNGSSENTMELVYQVCWILRHAAVDDSDSEVLKQRCLDAIRSGKAWQRWQGYP